MRGKTIAGVLIATLCALAGAPAQDQVGKQRELEQVRERIEKLRGVLDADVVRRDRLTARLRDIERLLGSVRSNLARLRTERESSEARRAALLEQKAQRQRDLEAERSGLARQLRTAYVNGRGERLRMLLSQRDAAALGRQSVYYRYLVASRVEQIHRVETHLTEIERLAAEVERETAHLVTLEERRAEELASLEKAAARRRELVAKLEKQIDDRGSQLDRLQREEAALVQLLEELRRVLAEFPVESQKPFATLRGRLAWPVDGTILGDFGEPRAGQTMSWNGVLIAAERGAHVRAVAHGRVAYADWLPGLGLLIVVEHGDGYLSLYGHNERLDKAAGDWVDAGDVLGTVGDSGGQPRPALYFEIRRERRPLDPHPWFATRLARRPG